MSTTNLRERGGAVADASRARYDPGAMEETVEKMGTARVTGVAQVFDLHALKAFAPDKRVRKMLFKTDQLWSEIACYEPGQSTVMHTHPKEEEAIFVLEGTAHMSIDGEDVVVNAGSIVKFPRSVMHDVRNLGPERCVIMFLKVNPKLLTAKADG
jgi:quercetin dioxygenase-like cupin family protein